MDHRSASLWINSSTSAPVISPVTRAELFFLFPAPLDSFLANSEQGEKKADHNEDHADRNQDHPRQHDQGVRKKRLGESRAGRPRFQRCGQMSPGSEENQQE